MSLLPGIWLCAHCTTSFDAGPPSGQQAFAGCPRCQLPRTHWSPAVARHLAAGGSLPGAFALAELWQQLNAFYYRHHRGKRCLLKLTLNLADDAKLTLTSRATLRRRLRLSLNQLLQCAN